MSSENNTEVRVRYAPSPTGIPHVGNIRTALFDYFFARSRNGKFILRIEDTDQARKIEGAEDAIKESLMWLGAKWDEYVVQSERLDEYRKNAEQLLSKGLAREDEGAIRFVVPKDRGEITWEDAVGNRTISFSSDEIEDFIILKKDGYPTYHLANVVDDHLMEITHVIRGDDWISSTPKHILLYEALGWERPAFAHVPNVMGEDGKKLSKRRGAKSVVEYRNEGYLPEALMNYLMLLGWSPKNDQTILSEEDIIREFDLEKISSAPSIFSVVKLDWMNGEYIRSLNEEELLRKVTEFDESVVELDKELVRKLVEPAKTRMKKLGDFKSLVSPFIEKKELGASETRSYLLNLLEDVNEWNKENIIEKLKEVVSNKKVKFQDIYEAVIGERQGLPLGDVFEILGKERTLALLK